MLHGKRIVVVMPAYNAAETLRATYNEIPLSYVDAIVLVDDASTDETVAIARGMGIETIVHPQNRGYGGNQKTCYTRALELGADVVVMLHPDYQYTPRLLVAMASLIAVGQYEIVLGSRILTGGALRGGMPIYKYVSNRFLTAFQNLLTGAKLSEYHTGYRAFSREVLTTLPLEENSDDFVFDNQMLCQALYFGFAIGEISCPAKYFAEASSIKLGASTRYGLGVMKTTLQFWLQRRGLARFDIYRRDGGQLRPAAEARGGSTG
jgi:glycosyltransferase involved in cell wall biosynthesis